MAAEQYRKLITDPSDRVIVALDDMDWQKAATIMDEVGNNVGMGKANSIALELGWVDAVGQLSKFGVLTMADPKLHDIPKTVELGAKAITHAGASLITVHSSGGSEALKAAVTGRESALKEMASEQRVLLGGILGITVLTSLSDEQSLDIYGGVPSRVVPRFARMAADAGVDGIVCSPLEVAAIRNHRETEHLLLVVPGITPDWAKKASDQSRVGTPRNTVLDGADFLVVGRAITQPPLGMNRAEAAARVAAEIKETGA